MTDEHWIFLVYLAVATVVCIHTWIKNSRVHHVSGPPSGFMTGIIWPISLTVVVLFLVVTEGRKLLRGLSE